ncbi:hypothetical protein [Pseudonocardia sp. ICBG601]|nr:hypothetical protein [Pseudonocardia sp. ICBG601]
MNNLAAAFRRKSTHPALPRSIQGLWKADLFLGSPEREHWVGTTIKIQPRRLETAEGLRIAIVPAQGEKSDAVRLDEGKGLVICPIPHDYSFMQTFHEGMRIVQVLMVDDFSPPEAKNLPNPQHREVGRAWAERRDLTVEDALDSMVVFAQPHLLEASTEELSADTFGTVVAAASTTTMIGPVPLRSPDA